ncbi:MAG: hypothetical protein LBQ40_06770 [Clostridiales bacterium]|jgi:MFS family permease|nr:hypothetical protein [Clostridiales bacterium]
MYYKYSRSVLLSNLGLVFGTFLYGVIVVIVILALGAGILVPTLRPVYNDIESAGYIDEASGIASGLLRGEKSIGDAAEETKTVYQNILDTVGKYGDKLFFSYIIVAVLLFFAGFLKAAFDPVTTAYVGGYMSSKMRGKLASGYFSHPLSSLAYAALKSLISGGLTLLIAVSLLLLFNLFPNFLTLLAVIVVGIALFSLKFALFAGWSPNIFKGEKTLKALKNSFDPKRGGGFKAKFYSGVCFYSVLTVCVMAFTLTTFGLILFIVLPIYPCMLRIMELVHDYSGAGDKFYIDDFTIVVPKL